jgi:hypothetical protein
MDNGKLRGAIYSKFKSASAFADALGWTKQKLSNVLTGKKIPNVTEIADMARAMKMSNAELLAIFLPQS